MKMVSDGYSLKVKTVCACNVLFWSAVTIVVANRPPCDVWNHFADKLKVNHSGVFVVAAAAAAAAVIVVVNMYFLTFQHSNRHTTQAAQ